MSLCPMISTFKTTELALGQNYKFYGTWISFDLELESPHSDISVKSYAQNTEGCAERGWCWEVHFFHFKNYFDHLDGRFSFCVQLNIGRSMSPLRSGIWITSIRYQDQKLWAKYENCAKLKTAKRPQERAVIVQNNFWLQKFIRHVCFASKVLFYLHNK